MAHPARGSPPGGPDPTVHLLTIAYLLFADVLWPALVPAAVWLVEPAPARRKAILLTLAAGAATSLYYLAALATHPVSAAIFGAHVSYSFSHEHETLAFVFYVVATCLAPLLSSYRTVRLLGAVIIGSMIAAYWIYLEWFASVWCFFAAVASVVVFLHFTVERPARTARG